MALRRQVRARRSGASTGTPAPAGPTKLYLQNAAAGYTPTTIRGAWDDTAAMVTTALGSTKSGAVATVSRNETNASATFDVGLLRFVSPALTRAITLNGTINWILGVSESNADANMALHLHAYVTTGDTDTPRGTLITDLLETAGNEWAAGGASTTGKVTEGGSVALTSVAAEVGDRIVIEYGAIARNTLTDPRNARASYGGTGNDLTDGGDATTLTGWIEFSQGLSFT